MCLYVFVCVIIPIVIGPVIVCRHRQSVVCLLVCNAVHVVRSLLWFEFYILIGRQHVNVAVGIDAAAADVLVPVEVVAGLVVWLPWKLQWSARMKSQRETLLCSLTTPTVDGGDDTKLLSVWERMHRLIFVSRVSW